MTPIWDTIALDYAALEKNLVECADGTDAYGLAMDALKAAVLAILNVPEVPPLDLKAKYDDEVAL